MKKMNIPGLENNFFKITKNAPHFQYLIETKEDIMVVFRCDLASL